MWAFPIRSLAQRGDVSMEAMDDVLSAEMDLSTDELFVRVLEEKVDDAEFLGALVALHGRPTRQVVDRSLALCASAAPRERCVGLRVLRELNHPYTDRKARWEGIEPTVLHLALSDEDPDVVGWAILCLGNQAEGPGALAAVLSHVAHEDENVRFTVAAALPGLAGESTPDRDAVEALTKLADDSNPDVRSYALMGLIGDLGLLDELRPVVKSHLADQDDQIREYCRRALDGEQI